MDIQDLKQESQDGNRYLLVVVDRASKFLFAYPLPSKDAVGVSRKLLELLLTFGVPLSVRGDAGGELVHSAGGETLMPVAESVNRLRPFKSPPCLSLIHI